MAYPVFGLSAGGVGRPSWRAAACSILSLLLLAGSPALAQSSDAPPAPIITPSAPPPPPPPPMIHIAPALGPAQTDLLRRFLAGANEDGIGESRLAGGCASVLDGQALAEAAMEHAVAVRGGRLRGEDYRSDWGLRPKPFDPWPGFLVAVQQDRLAAWLDALSPPYPGYDGLRRGLATYRAIADKGGWSALGAGPDLAVGAVGPRVTALRKRLAIEDASAPKPADPAKYDAALAEQVKRAQKRYGLEPTGALDKATLAALNVSAGDRVRQLRANMERWRWLPPKLSSDRIQVNIAAAVLTLFEADRPVMSMRAATGRPGDETPMLQSTIHSVVLNPPWNVPMGIAKRELFPKGNAYLARNGYKIIPLPGGGRRLQQAAGPQSALGRYKFDFDNPYAVYLHDTPSRGAFDRYTRQVSHGCVRLAKPEELAKRLLEGDTKWTPEAIDETIAGGKTTRAPLPQPVEVYLLYWTAFAAANGQISFRADPYGWDNLLATRLDRAVSATPLSVASNGGNR